ncbi:MAG: cell division protein FtsA [Candidatus Latescibacterota bacterium]
MPVSPIVVLDIGASQVVCLIGEAQPEQEIRILGVGRAPCAGLRRSTVIDMPRVVESIRRAVDGAERSAGLSIASAYAGLSGEEVVACTSRSTVAIAGMAKPIDEDDLGRAMTAAEQAAPTDDQVVLHRFVQSYAVDGQPVQNPLWLHGSKLEVEILTISASRHACSTLERAAGEAGVEIAGFILEPVAAASAVVSHDEREMGVGVLDIGAGTTSLALFSGPLRHIAEIPHAGEDITRDLSVVFGVSPRIAEQLKREYGCVCCAPEAGEESITFQTTAGRTCTITRQQLSDVVEARQHEILEFVRREIGDSGYGPSLAAGMSLTGGGSLLQGLAQLGEQVLGMPVRLGQPQEVVASEPVEDPQFATAVGLLRFAALEQTQVAEPSGSAGGGTRFLSRIARLLSFF